MNKQNLRIAVMQKMKDHEGRQLQEALMGVLIDDLMEEVVSEQPLLRDVSQPAPAIAAAAPSQLNPGPTDAPPADPAPAAPATDAPAQESDTKEAA